MAYKFNSLTAKRLDKNKEIYDVALDHALSDDSVRNIAITGIASSGKSSVWKTYVNSRKIENVLNVSLGKYSDTFSENETLEDRVEKNNILEKQILNILISQIENSKIPLSKNKFFKDINVIEYMVSILPTVVLIATYFVIDNRKLFFIAIGVFIITILIHLYRFFNSVHLRFSTIKLPFGEAKVEEKDNKYETVFYRDAREIVYVLSKSKSNIVVFDELDSYNDVLIYEKLKYINTLVNEHLKTIGINRIIKFVYILRDGMFDASSRVKFFDFILPIVPVSDHNNAEERFLELLKDVKCRPYDVFVEDISVYVNDMRLIKNIVNEYVIYSEVIDIEENKLSANKFLSTIVLKNTMPYEFDLLQEDKGSIIEIFKNIEKYRKNNESYKDILSKLEKDKIDEIFNVDAKVVESGYFSLLKFLISDGLIDEDYYNYKSYFSTNNSMKLKYEHVNKI